MAEHKAQVMIEFLIALTVVVIVCGTAFYIALEKQENFQFVQTRESAVDLCNNVALTIDETYAMGIGAAFFYEIPLKINYINYSAQVKQNSVIVSFLNNSQICPFSSNATNGTHSDFLLSAGNKRFYNNGNQVVVSIA